MLESEAMALLVSAVYQYARREAALRAAGSALGLIADPFAFARELGEGGAAAVKRSVMEKDALFEKLELSGVRLLARGEAGYSTLLAQTALPPHLLFVRGETNLGDELPIAVVGTRKANEYGLRHSRKIARELAGAGACIVSGLATGVDAQAHEGALDAGARTIAVLGGAHDRFFPAENRALAEEIVAAGGSIVTEYPMGMPPTRYSFLHRNRIIAGLSLGVLATQGAYRSGAHRTVSDAADEGREVFALPGSVDDTRSQLPHKLIGEGAHLATCAADILRVLAPQREALLLKRGKMAVRDTAAVEKVPASAEGRSRAKSMASTQRPKKAPAKKAFAMPEGIDDAHRVVLEALMQGEQEFDALCEMTGLAGDEMGALLMELEIDGIVDSLPGLRYALSGEV